MNRRISSWYWMKAVRLSIILLVDFSMAVVSCRSVRNKPVVSLTDNYCAPSIQYNYDSTYLPNPAIQTILQTDTSLIRRYSQHDLLLANAAGILPLIRQLIAWEKGNRPNARLEISSRRQQIFNRLLLVSTQIAGFSAELDCAAEQADQIATYLDQRDTRRVRRLTILSAVIGAATTVATALVHPDNASKVVGISGGVVSAGFGGLAAFSSHRTVLFRHPRNLLADIWNQPKQSSVYPPMIWYVLNEKMFSNGTQHSISYNTRQRWKDYVLNGYSTEQQQLYFGESGNYQADDLHNRANMLNQLQSSIRSINQDLQSLVLAVSHY